MTEKEFLKKQGKGFFLRLFKYFTAYSTNEEIKEIADNNQVLQAEFIEGVYTIRYNDLLNKMKLDLEEMGISPDELENYLNNDK